MPAFSQILGVANNALYLGLGYTGLQTVSAGLGGLVVSANPVFTAVLAAAFLGEALTWRKVMGLLLGIAGVGFIVWHRMSVGTDDWHGILFTLASLASIVAGTILFKVLAPKGSLWVGNGVQNLSPASCCCRLRSRWPMPATSCRARGSSARSPSSC